MKLLSVVPVIRNKLMSTYSLNDFMEHLPVSILLTLSLRLPQMKFEVPDSVKHTNSGQHLSSFGSHESPFAIHGSTVVHLPVVGSHTNPGSQVSVPDPTYKNSQ